MPQDGGNAIQTERLIKHQHHASGRRAKKMSTEIVTAHIRLVLVGLRLPRFRNCGCRRTAHIAARTCPVKKKQPKNAYALKSDFDNIRRTADADIFKAAPQYRPGEIVEPLRVHVPLDPTKILRHPLGRLGQPLGIGQHLVRKDTPRARCKILPDCSSSLKYFQLLPPHCNCMDAVLQ